MVINNTELIEIEQKLLKTITGNGLAIIRFMEWLKKNNLYNKCDCGKPVNRKYDPCCSVKCWSNKFEK